MGAYDVAEHTSDGGLMTLRSIRRIVPLPSMKGLVQSNDDKLITGAAGCRANSVQLSATTNSVPAIRKRDPQHKACEQDS